VLLRTLLFVSIVLAMGYAGPNDPLASPAHAQAGATAEPALKPSTMVIDGVALRISVPPTWRTVQEGSTVFIGPDDGQRRVDGKTRISYGIELGVTRSTRREPNAAFEILVDQLQTSNRAFRSASIARLVTLAGRLGLRETFANTSAVTGHDEFVVVAAAPVDDGRAMHVIGVAPREQFAAFRPTFEAILLTIEKAQ
jgi:hypothetical protein